MIYLGGSDSSIPVRIGAIQDTNVTFSTLSIRRNSTSYDRYYEGRKDFGTMMSCVRVLSVCTNIFLIAEP